MYPSNLSNVFFDTCGPLVKQMHTHARCLPCKDGRYYRDNASNKSSPRRRHASVLKAKRASDGSRIPSQHAQREPDVTELIYDNYHNGDNYPDQDSFYTACSGSDDLNLPFRRRDTVSIMQSAIDVMAATIKVGEKIVSDGNDQADNAVALPKLAQIMRIRRCSSSQLTTRKSFESCVNYSFDDFDLYFEGEENSTERIGFNTYQRSDPSDPSTGLCTFHRLHGSEFLVRDKGYKKTGNKVPSEGNLYEVWGMDAITSNEPVLEVAPRLVNTNCHIEDTPPGTLEKSQIPALFILTLHCAAADENGLTLVSYHVISPQARSLIGTDKEPTAFTLLRRIIDQGHLENLKMIGSLVDIDNYSIPMLIRQYNGKPVKLLKNEGSVKIGRMTQLPGSPSYIEATVDTSKFCWLFRTTLATMRHKVENMSLNLALLAETDEDEYLPEHALLSVCVRKPTFRNIFVVPGLDELMS